MTILVLPFSSSENLKKQYFSSVRIFFKILLITLVALITNSCDVVDTSDFLVQEKISTSVEDIKKQKEACNSDISCKSDTKDDSNFKINFRFKDLLTKDSSLDSGKDAGLGDGLIELLESGVNFAKKIDKNLEKSLIEFPKLDEATQDKIRQDELRVLKEKAGKTVDFLVYLTTPQFQNVDGPRILEEAFNTLVTIEKKGNENLEGAYKSGKFSFKVLSSLYGAGQAKLALKSPKGLAKLTSNLPENSFKSVKLVTEAGKEVKLLDKATNKLISKGDKAATTFENVALALPRAGTRGGEALSTLAKARKLPGKAIGTGKTISGKWLRGAEGNAGFFPKSIADKMKGKNYKNFDEFRADFWKKVADDPELAKQFNAGNRTRMKQGLAPKSLDNQKLGKKGSYEIHHNTPINQGGSVYDFDNLTIVTPKYHKEILSPSFHFGYGY